MTNAMIASLSELTSASPSDVGDRPAEGERGAHVAGEQAADPVEVLRDERLVRAEPLVQRIDGPLVGERPEDAAPDVARQHLRPDEHDQAQQEQRDQAEQDALADEAGHYDFTRPARLRSKCPIAVTSMLAMSDFAPVR